MISPKLPGVQAAQSSVDVDPDFAVVEPIGLVLVLVLAPVEADKRPTLHCWQLVEASAS
jgi:hypothetical protein